MWNTPTKQELAKLPKLYETEHIGTADKQIFLHFFMGGCDWYIAEYDAENELFFGFTVLNNDYDMAEWGYISFQELRQLKHSFIEVDRDLYWDIKKASDVEQIVKAGGV
jgi:Ca2+-binding EF-hand superfamily protein